MTHHSHHHHHHNPFPHHHHHHHHNSSHHHHHHHHHDEEQLQPPRLPSVYYGTFQGVANVKTRQQTVTGYPVADGMELPLTCCGCGMGWFSFIIGFLLAGIPWYVAALILLCADVDPREKPGYIACTVAAVFATFALIIVFNW